MDDRKMDAGEYPGYPPMGYVKLEGLEMGPYGQVLPAQFQQMQQLQTFNAMQMQMRMQLYPFSEEKGVSAPVGMTPQGMGLQGMGPQGMAPQGMAQQSLGSQGMNQQSLGAQGMSQQGMAPQGMSQQGMAPQGMPPQGMAPQGMAPQGMALQGMAPQGMAPQGLVPRGLVPRGMSPHGMGPHGVGLQGMGSQGVVSVEAPASKRIRRNDHVVEDSDAELKQLAYQSLDTPFPEFAAKVRASEDKPSGKGDDAGERLRQVFGMVWLLKACEAAPSAVVPRSRIYARYANVCADNVVKPLSPASFGKLVRILFPNLPTRRLGMRGQSKYHYCGIKLVGEDGTSPRLPAYSESPFPTTPSNHGLPGLLALSVSTPLPSLRFALTLPPEDDAYALQYISNLHELIDRSNNANNLDKPLVLPSVHEYLPQGTDADAADTLTLLYRSHCTALFEAMRYMQVKKLFFYLSLFGSTLTAPVLKLYTSPALLPWVERADLATYRAIIKMLTKLSLQAVPAVVLAQLRNVSDTFPLKVQMSVQSMPANVGAAKGRAARAFANLLARLVKVVETGQAALKVLGSPTDRAAMRADWMLLNCNEIILRELPCSVENGLTVLNVLTRDVPSLLDDPNPGLAPLSAYLPDVAAKFPDVSPRLYLLISSNLLTVCLRKISMAGGSSFGSWWLVRCWVDEYMNWSMELGGFLALEFSEGVPETCPAASPAPRVEGDHFVDLLDGNFGFDGVEGFEYE